MGQKETVGQENTMAREDSMAYDSNNIFARILRGEIPCDKVYEDEFALAFRDIQPKAPVHVLVIPKGEYETMEAFSANAPAELVAGFFKAVGTVATELGLTGDGYRVIINSGPNGGQEVFHLHAHIVGGRPLGRMVQPAK